MKIAIDARIISSSTGRYVERLIHYIEQLDNENEYLILVRHEDMSFYTPQNKRFQLVEANFEDYSINEQFGFARLLYALKPDLVHFCMPQQPIFYTGRHITTIHDLTLLNTYNSDKNFIIYKLKQLIGRFVFFIIGRTSSYILCPSNFTKNAYAQFSHIDPNKIIVTPEAADLAHVEPEPYEPLINKQFLLYVGQQSDYKNIRRLIQAHQELRKKHPELLLALVGKLSGKNGVPLLRNREWVEHQGYQGVIFTDFVTDQQLRWLYKYCATYVFPSLMEGFGLPGLEAMASGAAVVSSNVTSLPEVHGNGAYYFNPYDVVDMTHAISQVLDNKTLRSELIQRGAEVVKQYSWQRMAKQTLAVYRQALIAKK